MKILNLLLGLTFLYPVLTEALPTLVHNTPPPITAPAYLLQDFHSNQIIMEKNVDERLEPASLTKLMTAYIVFRELHTGRFKLTDKVIISEKAWRMLGSRMYLEVDSQVAIELLLKGMIIQSGNDASVALAEFIAGSEETFVALMNEQTQRLDLSNTHYTNSTGLPNERHYSSVRDIVNLTQALIRDFPQYYRWYSMRKFTYNGITQENRNRLLRRDARVDGVKTGHTEAAGYCLVTSAKRGEMRLISVIMGATSEKKRIQESQQMLDYGFRFFETYRPYQAHQPLDIQPLWHGTTNQLPLGLEQPLYVTVPTGNYKQLTATLSLDKYITAPVMVGETYGSLKISLNQEVISERPIIALSSIDKGSFWNRLIDSFLLLFY
ncbi:MAG TPA: D-alanyl-D-alanine carboxypeptidase [Thiotrichaceae bacterium]|nr:D-alanyl-D-alanine carboxypeptidase [Thiotrichaceae bacterium]